MDIFAPVLSIERKEKIQRFKMENWQKYNDGVNYAYTVDGGRIQFLHEMVMEEELGRKIQPDELVYPLDGNGLNCQSENLAVRKMTRDEMEARAVHAEEIWRPVLARLPRKVTNGSSRAGKRRSGWRQA